MPETEGEKIKRQIAAIKAQGGTDKDIATFLSSHPSVKPEPLTGQMGHAIIEKPEAETAGDRAAGLIREGYQGLTLGAGSKLIAGARALLPEAAGGTKGFDYSGALAEENQGREDFERLHPVASRVAEVAGGVPTMIFTGGGSALKGASATGKVLRLGLQGAAYGGSSGALSSDKLSDVPEKAVSGAGKGFAAALLLHSGGKLLGAGARMIGLPEGTSWLAGKGAEASSRLASRGAMYSPAAGNAAQNLRTLAGSIGRQGQASSAVADRLASEGETPASIAARQASNVATSGEKPEILADYSPEVGKLTKAVTKQPGPGRAAINRVFSDRQGGVRERVIGDVSQGQPVAPFGEHLSQLVEARDESAARMFPAAYKAGAEGIDDPAVLGILQRPTFKKALKMAQTMAADDGVQLPTTTTVKLTDKAQALVDQSKPADQAALRAKLLKNPSAVTRDETPIPDVRTIHYVNRAVRRMIDGGFEGSSPIVDSQHALALEGTLRELRTAVAKKVPEFDAAMADFAKNSAPIEALNTGRDILKYANGERVAPQAMGIGTSLAMKSANKGIDGLEAAVHNMTPQGQELFRHAALGRVIQEANRVPSTTTGSTVPVLRRIFADTPEARRWQRLLFKSPDEAGAFQQALSRERTMARTSAQMSGSDTAENLAEGDAMTGSLGLGTMITHPLSAAKTGFAAIQKSGQKQLYSALGQRLSNTKLQNLLKDIAREQAMKETMGGISSAVRNSTAAKLSRGL